MIGLILCFHSSLLFCKWICKHIIRKLTSPRATVARLDSDSPVIHTAVLKRAKSGNGERVRCVFCVLFICSELCTCSLKVGNKKKKIQTGRKYIAQIKVSYTFSYQVVTYLKTSCWTVALIVSYWCRCVHSGGILFLTYFPIVFSGLLFSIQMQKDIGPEQWQ